MVLELMSVKNYLFGHILFERGSNLQGSVCNDSGVGFAAEQCAEKDFLHRLLQRYLLDIAAVTNSAAENTKYCCKLCKE